MFPKQLISTTLETTPFTSIPVNVQLKPIVDLTLIENIVVTKEYVRTSQVN